MDLGNSLEEMSLGSVILTTGMSIGYADIKSFPKKMSDMSSNISEKAKSSACVGSADGTFPSPDTDNTGLLSSTSSAISSYMSSSEQFYII